MLFNANSLRRGAKKAEDSQEFSTGAVALVKASRIYVDDDEIEVDVSEHDGGEQ